MKWLLALKQRTQKARWVLKDDKRRNFVETDRAVVFLVSKHIAKLNDYVPTGLRVYLKARGSIPKNLIILTIVQTHTAYVRSENRYEIVDFGNGVYSAKASFGFMEKPDTLFVLKYLYKKEVFDDKFLRCTLEVSEDDFIVEKNVRFKYKILTSVFRFLAKNSIPRYKYFWFHTDVTPGISKTIVPIHIGSKWAYVDIPEFAFEASEKEKLRSKTSPKAVKFRDMWKVGV